jgi:glycosyltransferase involved in cell wall biosynthesis
VRTLRIIFLGSFQDMSGTYWRAFFAAKYLVKEGHEVTLIASSRKATLRVAKKMVDGVRIFLLPSPTALDGRRFVGSLSRISVGFMQMLVNCFWEGTSDADVLHSFDVVVPQNAAPTLLSKISRLLRIHDRKIFADWDEWYGRGGLLSQYGGIYLFMEPLMAFLEEKVPSSVDAVTVCSETLRQRALSMGVRSENLFLIPNGANVDSIKPLNTQESRKKLNLPNEKIICSYLGVSDMESLKLLISAHKKVVRSHPDAFLLFVGLREDQRDFVKSLGMTKNVMCIEKQPYHAYSLYLGASDILLLPMQDNLYNRSRHPLRLMDYLAAGRPIIATALPEIARVVHKCGLVAKPSDPSDFACKILKVAKDPDFRKCMGRHARELAEKKYSWHLIVKQLEKMYSKYL